MTGWSHDYVTRGRTLILQKHLLMYVGFDGVMSGNSSLSSIPIYLQLKRCGEKEKTVAQGLKLWLKMVPTNICLFNC